MPNPLRPRGLQPARLLCPWGSPGKNTGVGCHFLLQCWMNEYPANVSPGKSSLGSFSVSVSRGRSLKADSFIHFCACSPGLPRWLSGKKKNPPANVGDAGDSSLIPGSGRSPGGGNDNPLQYSCLENPMARGAWQTTPHKKAMSLTRLSTHMHVCVVIVVQLLSSM